MQRRKCDTQSWGDYSPLPIPSISISDQLCPLPRWSCPNLTPVVSSEVYLLLIETNLHLWLLDTLLSISFSSNGLSHLCLVALCFWIDQTPALRCVGSSSPSCPCRLGRVPWSEGELALLTWQEDTSEAGTSTSFLSLRGYYEVWPLLAALPEKRGAKSKWLRDRYGTSEPLKGVSQQ